MQRNAIKNVIEILQKILNDYHEIIKLNFQDQNVRITTYYLRNELKFFRKKNIVKYEMKLTILQHKYDLKNLKGLLCNLRSM